MIKNKLLYCVTTAFLLASCGGPGATQNVTKSGERHTGLFGMSKTDAVTVKTDAAFKDVSKVVVGGFAVGFATYKTESSKAGGGLMGSGYGGKSTAKSKLNGIDDKTMQAITNDAYKSFVADLKKGGYTIVDRKELLGSEAFAKTKAQANPYEDSSTGIFGSGSTTKYFAPSSFDGLMAYAGDIQSLNSAFDFDNALNASVKYAKDTNVKVLNVIYLVDFANAEKYGSWATSSSSVNVGQGITVVPEFTHLNLTGGEGGTFATNSGSIRLGQPISSDKAFATVTDATSATAKTVEVATNVIGVLGGVGSNASREFEFQARPKDFKVGAVEVLTKANEAIIGKMTSLK